jgi:aldehyde dehydrogenase (NAD+)
VAQVIADTFPSNEVALFEGSLPTSTALLELPFDHIFFTGSPAVGKVVMAAAASTSPVSRWSWGASRR